MVRSNHSFPSSSANEEETLNPSSSSSIPQDYRRVPQKSVKDLAAGTWNRKLRARIRETEKSADDASREARSAELVRGNASRSGYIETENELEKTWRLKQRDLLKNDAIDENTRFKSLDLRLPGQAKGYKVKYSHSGQHMLLAGSKGHVAVVEALRNTIVSEQTNLGSENEYLRDATFYHNETLHAVAQRKYVFVYEGTREIHRLTAHIEPLRLEFLRHHMLLVSSGRSGYIKYQDVSTGALVSTIRTRMGPCSVMGQNHFNGIIASGHDNGTVCYWAPSQSGSPLVKILCHRAPLTDVAFYGTNYLITSSLDGKVSIWDARKFGKVFSYRHHEQTNVEHLSVSQTGLLSMASRGRITIWKDGISQKAQEPYMTHRLPNDYRCTSTAFRPYEDVLAIGHTGGVQTILIPGAGEAKFDAYTANPFERKTQRREAEIRLLLDKLPFSTIGLTGITQEENERGGLGGLDLAKMKPLSNKRRKMDPPPTPSHTLDPDDDEEEDGDKSSESGKPVKEIKLKRKMKGRGKIGNRLRVKRKNIVTAEREAARQASEELNKRSNRDLEREKAEQSVGPALARFKR